MKDLNIRVYKTITLGGIVRYVYKTKDERFSHSYKDVRYIASDAYWQIKSFFENNDPTTSHVTIDFMPYHEVEYVFDDLSPVKCYPLDEKETKLFWERYEDSLKELS